MKKAREVLTIDEILVVYNYSHATDYEIEFARNIEKKVLEKLTYMALDELRRVIMAE